YFAKDLDGAETRARAVTRDSIVGADAEMLVGDVLRARGDDGKTADWYRDYLSRRPDGPRDTEARFRLAQALGDTDEARQLYRQITIEDPLSSWATDAAKSADPTPLTGAEHLTKGQVLFDAMRNPESEAEMTAALADGSLTPKQKCTASYEKAQARFK